MTPGLRELLATIWRTAALRQAVRATHPVRRGIPLQETPRTHCTTDSDSIGGDAATVTLRSFERCRLKSAMSLLFGIVPWSIAFNQKNRWKSREVVPEMGQYSVMRPSSPGEAGGSR